MKIKKYKSYCFYCKHPNFFARNIYTCHKCNYIFCIDDLCQITLKTIGGFHYNFNFYGQITIANCIKILKMKSFV